MDDSQVWKRALLMLAYNDAGAWTTASVGNSFAVVDARSALDSSGVRPGMAYILDLQGSTLRITLV